MYNKRSIAAILLLLMCSQNAFSQNYTSDKLKTIAKKAKADIDTSLSSGYYDAGEFLGIPLCVGVDGSHSVFHVGYKLFTTEMKTQYPSEVYDFLERYLLELECMNSEVILRQYLEDDGVVILGGSLTNTKQITPSTPFSFTKIENAFYDIEWNASGKTLLKLRFPINFELLLGTRKNELEIMLNDLVEKESNDFSYSSTLPRLEIMRDAYFRSAPLETYQLEVLNTAEYYERDEAGGFTPIYDDSQPLYSLSNLFRGLIDNEYKLNVKQNLYGYKKKSFSVSLLRWINYCKSKKLRVYTCATEDEEKPDIYKVMVIAQSIDLAYNHLLTVEVPKDFMSIKKATFKASLNAFIPTHNIKTIYQETLNKK